jgi:hypothetical protein
MYLRKILDLSMWLVLTGSVLFISSCTRSTDRGNLGSPSPQRNDPLPPSVNLPERGQAPEIDTKVWLNVEESIHIRQLRGTVILLDFWTFG